MSITALSVRRTKVHEAIALGMVLFVVAYIGLLFARLGQ